MKRLLVMVILFKLALSYSYIPPHPDIKKSDVVKKYSKMQNKKANNNNTVRRAFAPFKTKDRAISPVLLIEFSDRPASSIHSTSYFNNLLFSDQEDSMATYYKTVSYGKVEEVSGVITDWVTSDQTMSYYGQNDDNFIIQDLVREAVLKNDNKVNFSDYDTDDDGYVDQLIVIHSGQGEEKSGNSNDIWSHEWEMNDEISVDGVKIKSYTMQSEYSPMGIFAHEFGHSLGLADLYNSSTGHTMLGSFTLMDYGLWAGPDNDGTKPAHLSGWEKYMLGWIDPVDLSYTTGTYTINRLESESDESVYRVFLGASTEEYLIIENRQKVGFDAYLPGSGLLIYHIYEKDIDERSFQDDYDSNTLNNYTPQRVKLLEANGTNDILKNYGESADFFSSGVGYTQLLSYANNTPNSCLWNEQERKYSTLSNVSITNISASASQMTFKFTAVSADSNGNNYVDIDEIKTFFDMYGKTEYEEEYNMDFDFNKDGVIDIIDLNELKKLLADEIDELKVW